MPSVATLDFHVTSRCNQACVYCWGPRNLESEVDTAQAAGIVRKFKTLGVPRIVFTGGDPLLRQDLGLLIRLARQEKLETVVSITGDTLTPRFLRAYGRWIDMVSLPMDGADEETSSRTKKPGHLTAVLNDLKLLAQFPSIDIKIGTTVTRHNLAAVPQMAALLDRLAPTIPNRLYFHLFQVFPRSMGKTDWDSLLVTDEEFAGVRAQVERLDHPYPIRWLGRSTLDRLYVLILPNGRLAFPSGDEYLDLGPVQEMRDLDPVLQPVGFDAERHLQHARQWSSRRRQGAAAREDEAVAK